MGVVCDHVTIMYQSADLSHAGIKSKHQLNLLILHVYDMQYGAAGFVERERDREKGRVEGGEKGVYEGVGKRRGKM